MTNEISKDLVTHIIITFNRNIHFITINQKEKIELLTDKERISLGDSFIRVSSISEMLPIRDYYKTHPKERPQYDNIKPFEKLEPITPEQRAINIQKINEIRNKLKINV